MRLEGPWGRGKRDFSTLLLGRLKQRKIPGNAGEKGYLLWLAEQEVFRVRKKKNCNGQRDSSKQPSLSAPGPNKFLTGATDSGSDSTRANSQKGARGG